MQKLIKKANNLIIDFSFKKKMGYSLVQKKAKVLNTSDSRLKIFYTYF